MPYTQDWESIADTLKYLVAAGLAENEAKRQLCAAIADRKIKLRIILAEDPKRGVLEQPACGSEYDIPPRLSPADIDWNKSRSLIDWPPVGRRPDEPTMLHLDRIKHLLERKFAEIRLRTADVAAIFDPPSQSISARLPPDQPKPRPARGAKSRAVLQVVAELWPKGIPDGLTAKERNTRIIEWAREHELSIPSERTIQRTLNQLNS